MLQKQHGIYFSETPTPPASSPVSYRWLHIPTGTKGGRTIYLTNPQDIYKLLTVWNVTGRDEWLYYPETLK